MVEIPFRRRDRASYKSIRESHVHIPGGATRFNV
jgi:hypothetical protein